MKKVWIADFSYAPKLVVFCDGPPHNHLDQQTLDERLGWELTSLGYRVGVIRSDQDPAIQVARFPEVSGDGQ